MLLPIYTLNLTWYLLWNREELETKQMRNFIGSSYENLSTKAHSRKFGIALLALRHLRVYGLAYIITFALYNLVAQFAYVIYSSLALIALMGLSRPFA